MSMQPISKELQAAIQHLRPRLPTLLGREYVPFIERLDTFLVKGDEDRIYHLFQCSPEIYTSLLNAVAQQEQARGKVKGGFILHGDPVTLPVGFIVHGDYPSGEHKKLAQISTSVKQGTLFYCSASGQLAEVSPTTLAHPQAVSLCPQHQQPLSTIDSDNIEVQIQEGRGYMMLFYCAAKNHLVLISPTDFSKNARGDILCPDHACAMRRIPEAME